MSHRLLPFLAPLSIALLAVSATAQCANIWSLGGGPGGSVGVLAALPNGDLIAGTSAAVVRRTGGVWNTFGTFNGWVGAIAIAANGDIVVGGAFTNVSGTPASRIARWNGATWSALGSGVNGDVGALLALPNGELVAAGSFTSAGGAPANRIARWNGAWSSLGTGMDARVDSLAMLPNGDVVAGGMFATAGSANAERIARWDGSTWSALGAGMTGMSVYSLGVAPDGALIAGGDFASAGTTTAVGIARWNGATWSAMGSTQTSPTHLYAYRFAVLPNGDVLAAGDYTVVGSVGSFQVARWDGVAWTPIASVGPAPYYLEAIAQLPSGDLAFGGSFTTIAGGAAPGFAQLSTNCPATVQTYAPGCAGTVDATLPWTGSLWRANAVGLPPFGLVLSATGFASANLPLTAVFPTALPGCILQAQPDYVGVTLAMQGTASTSFALPNDPALAGTIYFHQMVAIDLTPSLTVTATNTLRLQIGSY